MSTTRRPGLAHDVRVEPVPYVRPHSLAQSAVWVVPTVVVGNATSHQDARWAGACLVAGVLWQLVFRRDLADRLAAICVLVATGTVLGAAVNVLLDGNAASESSQGALAAVLACLSGLVLTEQVLRFRDLAKLRRARRAAAAEKAVPARP